MFTSGELQRYVEVDFTATTTTEVQVTIPNITIDTIIIPYLKTRAGAGITLPYITTKNTTTGVVGFTSFASDTSTYGVIVMR